MSLSPQPSDYIIRDIYGVDSIEGLRDIQRAVNQRRNELESRGALSFKVQGVEFRRFPGTE